MSVLALIAALTLGGSPSANKPTQLKIDVKPVSAVVFVDGKRRGTGAKTVTVAVTPGKHAVKITNNKDAVEDSVVVKKGETLTWKWAFEDDRPPGHGTGTGAPAEEAPATADPTP